MRVLIVTKIFPSSVEPASAPFNRQQFRALSRYADVELLATIPWFPGAKRLRRWSPAGRLTSVPDVEEIDGLSVRHPRFMFLPKLGHALAGPLYAASLGRLALEYQGRVDVVLGAWAYPDGFAAVALGQVLRVPVVVKLHGSDINVLGRRASLRSQVGWTLKRAARIAAVSRPLAARAIALGAAPERVDVVPNGLDRSAFFVRNQAAARLALGLPLERPLVLFVGHLSEAKGAMDLISAFHDKASELGEAELVLVGDGAGAARCRRLAESLGIRAHFAGEQPHASVPLWLAAADLLALPSWNEGMPNVVLEALACGRPVVATHVGGIPDVVTPELGELVPPREPKVLGAALVRVLSKRYDPERLSAAAPLVDWDGSARLLHQTLLHALSGAAREAA